MDIEKVRRLLDELAGFMNEHEFAELEIDVDGAEVKLKKAGSQVHHQIVTHSSPMSAAPAPAAPPAPAAGREPAASAAALAEPGTAVITSPMVGTFYRAPKPDADPFVDVGDEVEDDTVLCIIEAMKVMNEIKAERKGRIKKILVENGEPVEYGQPLFQVAV